VYAQLSGNSSIKERVMPPKLEGATKSSPGMPGKDLLLKALSSGLRTTPFPVV
jgi:hypothetical protein